MGFEQATAVRKGVREVQFNKSIPGRQNSEIESLKSTVASLLSDPPKNRRVLESRYQDIRTLVSKIEERISDSESPTVLEIFDHDFQRVSVIYSHLHSGFLKEAGTSVLASEYRFFVGGLEGYLTTLEEASLAPLAVAS